MIRVGIVGYGYWGPNLARNFSEVADSEVIAISDLNAERLGAVQRRYPAVKITTDYRDLLVNPSIDAVVIATPVSTHFDLAMEALRADKHVLVEKPLTTSTEHANRLIEEAHRRKKILMVDHIFVYTGAVKKIRELVDDGRLGKPYYYDSIRINLGLFQHDVNVLWDLAVHDLSIMDYILGKQPHAVSATAVAHVAGQPADIAYLTCFFEDNLIAHIHVNWLSPVKIRRILISGDKQMAVYDDLDPSDKVKVYDSGITVDNSVDQEGIYQMLVGYRTGDMWAPNLDRTEALYAEAQHFVQCIQDNQPAITNGESGLRVVRILEAVDRSLAKEGERVDIDLT